jgi:hypothetical protein
MLTYRGAAVYTRIGRIHELNPDDYQTNDFPVIMKEVSYLEADKYFIDKRKMKRCELYQPINHASACVDVTRFNLYSDRRGTLDNYA